jgi:DNA modification methylase
MRPKAILYRGHVLDVLRRLPDGLVRCVVTSPPYWGLRLFGTPQVWGGEPGCGHTWGKEIARLRGGPHGGRSTLAGRSVLLAQAALKRTPSGRFCDQCGAWMGELGLEPTLDLYVQHLVEVFREVRRVLAPDGTVWLNLGDSYHHDGGKSWFVNHEGMALTRHVALKPKDLVGVPWTVALALRADGWWLRRDIVWHKPNAMPESVRDRPTVDHEYVFLLSRSERYYFDPVAVAEPLRGSKRTSGSRVPDIPNGSDERPADHRARRVPWQDRTGRRNLRTVWSIPTQPYRGAHFATFPEELARRCILAGTSERGRCPTCNAAWVRSRRGDWDPTCDHGEEPVPDVVLDPFGGTGTTAVAALGSGRSAVYVDLSGRYLALAVERIGPLLCEVASDA